jgi:hypothetical protein
LIDQDLGYGAGIDTYYDHFFKFFLVVAMPPLPLPPW